MPRSSRSFSSIRRPRASAHSDGGDLPESLGDSRLHGNDGTKNTQKNRMNENDEASLTSPDEKSRLIQAHSKVRQLKSSLAQWGIASYIGIAASCLIILSGWWFTAGHAIRFRAAHPAPEAILENIKAGFKELQTSTSSQP